MPFLRNLLFSGLIPWLALSSSLSATPLHVTGRVLDLHQGSGLAGARVELFPAYEGKTAPAPLASARTDQDGTFEIAAPESGCFRLLVRAEGHLPMEHPLVPLVEDRELPEAGLNSSQPLEVRMVGPDGQPVAGVTVRIAAQDPMRPIHGNRPLGWRMAARTGVSGPDGKVVLPIYQQETPEVTAFSPGFLEQRVKISPPAAILRLSPVRQNGPPAKPVPPRRISGKVADAVSGRPVPGALVWSGWPLVAPAVYADGEGRFQLDVPAEQEVWLEAAAAGFLPGERQRVKPGAAQPMLVKLDPAAEISGVVVDPAGQPVAGARIGIPASDPLEEGFLSAGVRSSADGRFRLTGLKPGGLFELTASREGFERTTAKARTSPLGRPAAPPLRIVMGRGRTALGRLVDEAGQPVVGAGIVLAGMEEMLGEAQQVTSNKEGRFDVPHLTPGRYMLIAGHPDHAPLTQEVEIPSGAPTVDLGDLVMPAGGGIEGRVTDTEGTPIEGAEVEATPALDSGSPGFGFTGMSMSMSMGPLRTGPDGSFRVPGLNRGGRFDLHVKHPAYAEVTVPGVESPTKEPVRIELKAARTVSGRVVNAEGEPVAGATVASVDRNDGLGALRSYQSLGVTDAEGRFRVGGLAPGTLNLEVSADGYQTQWLDGFHVPGDRDVDDVKVVLERGSWLDVRVLNAEGEPVPEASVFAVLQAPGQEETRSRTLRMRSFAQDRTDAQGRCRLKLAGPGLYAVKTDLGGKASVSVNAGPGGTPVEIRLPRGFQVSGRVIGEDGAGAPGIYVRSEGGPMPAIAQTEADGSFVFSGVAEGRYHLTASEPETGRASLDIEVAGRDVRGLELRLAGKNSSATLSGHFMGVPPEDLSGAKVLAGSTDSSPRTGRVERDGSYTITGLEPGKWDIWARTSSGRTAQGQIEIEEGARAAILDLNFADEITLSGLVLVDGAPLGGAAVRALKDRSEASFQMVQTSYDGTFSLRGLAPGAWLLVVSGADGIGTSRPVEITESREITLQITTGTFKATVLSATGEPVEGAVAALEAREPTFNLPIASTTARSGPDGALETGRLASGTYRLEVRAPGYEPRQETVQIRPGGVAVVEVRLRIKE